MGNIMLLFNKQDVEDLVLVYVFGNIKIQFLAIKSAIASTMFST